MSTCRLICLVLMICAVQIVLAAPPQRRAKPPQSAKPPRTGRAAQSLNGAWKFLADPEQTGEKQGWDHTIQADAAAAAVPSTWKGQGVPEADHIVWYWREFEVPAGWQGQTVRLLFGAAAERARVWLNGQLLGEHIGGATPFFLNVTSSLHIGASNLLAVRLEGDRDRGAGIWQSVTLLAHDEAYIRACFPQTDALGHVNALTYFLNTSSHEGDATFDATLVASDAPTRILTRTNQNLHLTPGSNQTTLLLSLRGRSLHLWSVETPFLYLLRLVFRQEQDVLDTLQVSLGFRDLGIEENEVTLNGARVKLVARAPAFFTWPVVIATPDEEAHARSLLQGLKAEGVTVISLTAPPPVLLHLADEEGMLVVERARPDQGEPTRAAELQDLLERDRVHPCIVAWDLNGGTEDEARALRQLDPTRLLLVGPASSPRLWLPNQTTPYAGTIPMGLLPRP